MKKDERRAELYSLLGELPGRDTPVVSKLISKEEKESYIFERISLDLNGIEPVPSLNGIYDGLTPNKGLDIIDTELRKIYKEDGAEECYELKKYPVAHLETAEMRKEAISFLNKWL